MDVDDVTKQEKKRDHVHKKPRGDCQAVLADLALTPC